MSLNYSENKNNANELEKNNRIMQEEIARLKGLLNKKEGESEHKNSLETTELKKNILADREKKEALSANDLSSREFRETKTETAKEGGKESSEKSFEDLSMMRTATPTKAQIKKITQQMKDADIAHQLVVLVSLARFEGVYYAIRIAKKMGNAYLLDRLHDAIVNDLFEELVKNKKLHL